MNTTTFENARVHDRVWSVDYGWGVVIGVSFEQPYCIKVKFEDKNMPETYKVNGKLWTGCRQTLFWDEVEFEAPVKPPRTKLIHGVEVPDISFKPKDGEDYYAIDLADKRFCVEFEWRDDAMDFTLYERGLCYPVTEEGKKAAILHAKAMLGIKD